MSSRSEEFIAISERAHAVAERERELDDGPLSALVEAAEEVAKSWSGSNLGYQANVYYEDFKAPPPGAMFSREWGFEGTFLGTRGDWRPYRVDEVVEHIERLAGNPDLGTARTQADSVRPEVDELIERARSLAAKISPPHDDYLRENIEELQRVTMSTVDALARMQMHTTSGNFPIRDIRALEGGWQPAGHQVALANSMHVRSPYAAARWLAKVCRNIAIHIEDETPGVERAVVQLGNKVFIGHGGASNEYLKLGQWLTELGLDWEVFDRTPTAGMSTKERLNEMLDDAQIAFLMMTPEDETAAGAVTARANVIHEVGLFQGRLGWLKAIVLLEEGCEEFSNIEGIGQIRYPKGNVRAVFEDIRDVLKREGII